MAKKLLNKVPEILKARGMDDKDLMYGARITVNTAKRWADPEEAQNIDRIDLETIISIATFLDASIEDLLEIVDDNS